METERGTPDMVDIPITVPSDIAENLADDLEQKGRVNLQIDEEDAPDVSEKIRWQLENEKRILKFVEEYDGD